MNHQNLTICKANKIIEAGYKLSLNEQRVVLACIGQVNSMEELLKTDEFELSAKKFAKLFSVSDENAYQALIDVTKSLFNRYVIVENPYPERPKVKRLELRWISSIKHLPDDGKVIVRFSQDILPYLSELKGSFTRYKLEHVGKMTCVYAIRLYELLMQWQSTGKREVELDWLKKQLQLDESYERMDNFKARVIDPAVIDINTNSNYNVSWTQRKTGRRVSHLTFEFSEKLPLVLEKPKKKTKIARKTENVKIDNLDYFADIHKKFGNAVTAAIPVEIVEQLKLQERW
ncbi:MAG: replication initiation protein [Methylococcales bacterium]|nr:replication initiation protein [Methylococcales bacterium]MDD5755322.1 replication initiation protein [Methylococcales bacterium]